MTSIFAGALVTRALKAEGVTHVFGLLGHELLSIYDACLDEGITVIGTRHETAAANMADAYARITGRPAAGASGPSVPAHPPHTAGWCTMVRSGSATCSNRPPARPGWPPERRPVFLRNDVGGALSGCLWRAAWTSWPSSSPDAVAAPGSRPQPRRTEPAMPAPEQPRPQARRPEPGDVAPLRADPQATQRAPPETSEPPVTSATRSRNPE